jgi:hypothetical protein
MSERLHPEVHPDPDSLSAFIEGVLPEHERAQCLAHLAECPRCREVVFLAQDALPAPAASHVPVGVHPDPDSLGAYIEGTLPEHERAQCLAHLAECPRCREIAFLAQEASATPVVSQPVPGWRRWFAPVPVFAAAVAVCVAVVSSWLYLRHTAGGPAPDVVAHVSEAPPPPAPPRAPSVATEAPSRKPAPRRTVPATPPEKTSPVPVPPPAVNVPVPPSLTVERAAAELSEISGTVTDPSGASVSGAEVHMRQLDGAKTADARTDMAGQFHVAGLPPGRYELRIGARGFRQNSSTVDLRPREVASVQSRLDVGSMSETVEVTAEAATIQADSASVSAMPSRKKAELPGKLPAVSTVSKGKLVLALNEAGTVFVSGNSGKSWKAVKQVWTGKVDEIAPANPSESSIAAFQLTTESRAVWLSRDGAHWYPAPPQH